MKRVVQTGEKSQLGGWKGGFLSSSYQPPKPSDVSQPPRLKATMDSSAKSARRSRREDGAAGWVAEPGSMLVEESMSTV